MPEGLVTLQNFDLQHESFTSQVCGVKAVGGINIQKQGRFEGYNFKVEISFGDEPFGHVTGPAVALG